MDVRGVVLVLPHSSVLERAIDVHTRWDPGMQRLPRINDALRATGEIGQPGSVRERAIEAMSVTFPIIHVDQAGEAEPLSQGWTGPKQNRLNASGALLHPYLRTRVQVLIVNEARPFNAVKYQQRFDELKEEAVSGTEKEMLT